MTPLAEQTILVTGATDGLGKAVAASLAGESARLILHGRDDARLEATADELGGTSGNDEIR